VFACGAWLVLPSVVPLLDELPLSLEPEEPEEPDEPEEPEEPEEPDEFEEPDELEESEPCEASELSEDPEDSEDPDEADDPADPEEAEDPEESEDAVLLVPEDVVESARARAPNTTTPAAETTTRPVVTAPMRRNPCSRMSIASPCRLDRALSPPFAAGLCRRCAEPVRVL